MSWIFLVLSGLSLSATVNALWPLRRPWWLKLVSFQAGWMANELPVHVLAGNVVGVALFALLDAFDERPGQVGLVLTGLSSAGLLVLAAAHRRAAGPMEAALRQALGPDYRKSLDDHSRRNVDEHFRRSWLVLPWLVWFTGRRVERIGGIVYAKAAGGELKLDVYRSTARPHNCPVLVQIHGGGWQTGDRRLEARPLMTRLAAHGWVCVAIDYRLSRRATWPDHIIDVKTALAWVRGHVSDYGGDPEFVAVTGGSSGGHLAALAALTSNGSDYQSSGGPEPPIRACVPFYGVYDFNNTLQLRAPAEMRLFLERPVVKTPKSEMPDVYERAAPLARVNPEAPPFLVIQGTSDNLVPPAESRAFVQRLRHTSMAPTAYVEVPRGQHAFDATPSVRTASVISGVERFLGCLHAVYAREKASATPNP